MFPYTTYFIITYKFLLKAVEDITLTKMLVRIKN